MSALVPSAGIVRRASAAAAAYTRARLSLIAALPGNPIGVEIRQIGEAYAFSARRIPNPGFNCVAGLTDDQVVEIPGLIEWYRARGIAPTFEVLPGIDAPKVSAALAQAGFAQTSFHAVLYAPPASAPSFADGVSVEPVGDDNLETFLDAYSLGWSVTDPAGFKNNVRGWLGLPGWTLLLARFEGAPAAAAIYFLGEKTAYCADSSAVPAMRGHGAHQALLWARRALAEDHGADLVTAQAAYLSTSHRNMERAGFKLLHTKALWRAIS